MMSCNNARGIIEKLHDVQVYKKVTEMQMDEALEHLSICGKCQPWFTQNMCPKIQNETDEDIRIMHGMTHEPLGSVCSYF